MTTAEFSKFAGILSAALSQHHLSGFEIAPLELHSKMNKYLLCGLSGTTVQTVSCGVIHRPELEPWLRNTACATLKLYDAAHAFLTVQVTVCSLS